MKRFIPLPKLLEFKEVYHPIFLIGFLFLLPSIIICIIPNKTKLNRKKIILLLLSLLIYLPSCLIFIGFFISLPEHVFSIVDKDAHQFILTGLLDDYNYYQLYKCDNQGKNCEVIGHYSNGRELIPVKLVFDERLNRFMVYQKIYKGTNLLFSYDKKMRDYSYVSGEFFNNENYVLYSTQDGELKSFYLVKMVSKSDEIGFGEFQQFGYLAKEKIVSTLYFDEFLDELQIWMDERKVYSFDGQPHCLVIECQLAPIE